MPRIVAAAMELKAAMMSVATSTAVVTQAVNRGPRTSTCAVLVVVDMNVLLLRQWTRAERGSLRPHDLAPESGAKNLCAATQQLQQQQQQPATRHRSTA